MGTQALELSVADPTRLQDAAETVHAVTGVSPVQEIHAGRLHATVADGGTMPEIVERLGAHNVEIKELSLRLPSLDDVFLALTGKTRSAAPDTIAGESLISSPPGGTS